MVRHLRRAESEVSARDLHVSFSPKVREAFRSIAVAAANSEHFDDDIYQIVKAWSADAPTSVHDVMISLALVGREVAAHVAATNDQAMQDAWDDVCLHLPDNGFTISQAPTMRR